MMGRGPVWSQAENDLLAQMVAAGESTAAISAALSRSVHSVSGRIHRLGLPRRIELHVYPPDLDQAITAAGATVRALSRAYGLPESAIRSRAQKLGARIARPRRPPQPQPPAATRDDAADHVRIDILLALLRRLRAGPCRLADLLAASGRSRAMVFRYLAAIRALGVRIPCRRGEYTVADWGIVDPARL